MFDRAINSLRNLDMIDKSDIIVACTQSEEAAAPGTAAADECSYLLAANEDGLRIFEVDRRTGTFLGTYSKIEREAIRAAGVNGCLGSFSVRLRTETERIVYETSERLYGREQKSEIARLKRFFESGFRNA